MAAGRHSEARRILEAVPEPDGRVRVLLGDVWRSLGRDEQAVESYWAAREDADAETRAAANCGLGEIARKRGDLYLAADRFRTARSDVVAARTRDRITLGEARIALERGNVAEAKRLRAAVQGSSAELESLDRELRARDPVVAAPTKVAAKPARERTARKPVKRRAVVASPPVVRRSQWKARRIRARGRPEPMGKVTRVTLHHTASKRLPGTSWSSNAVMMRNLQADHQDGRGWADLGYHYVIDRQGRVWQGRDARWQGAHAGNGAANRNNVGIALVGDFDRYAPSAAQKRSLKRLVRWVCSTHDVAPSRIAGHQHVLKAFTGGGTACPGRHLNAYLGELRRAVTADRRRAVGM